jgi:hypothetical protein
MAVFLPLRLAADHLLDFLFQRAAGGGTLGLGGGFFARRALELLALCLVFDFCGVGHVNLFPSNMFRKPTGPAFKRLMLTGESLTAKALRVAEADSWRHVRWRGDCSVQ